jgi:predicted DNA-binding transcriptional regulator AlpA
VVVIGLLLGRESVQAKYTLSPDEMSQLRSPSVAPEELVGVHEIMELLRVSKRTAHKYVERGDFPKPIEHLSTGRIWIRAEVAEWAQATLPLQTGRPPKEG